MIDPAGMLGCGICGRPSGSAGHVDHLVDGPVTEAGRRVEYKVVGVRGGIADFQTAESASKAYRTDAAVLAMQLGIEVADLVGRRFSCWVTPDEYGVLRSDFRRIES